MTDLVVTGPPVLDLRWRQRSEVRADGWHELDFFPKTHHQESDGYLHPGVAAAALLGAAEQTVGLPEPLGSVALAFDAPVPLGMDLAAAVSEDDPPTIHLEVFEPVDREEEGIRRLVRGSFGTETTPVPALEGAFRAASIGDVPEAVPQELYPRCLVCGQENTQGLALQPGWQAPDTVVSAFLPSEQMTEGDRLPPALVATLLSCQTLWACKSQLDELEAVAALMASYEVRFLEPAPVGTALRTVGLAGEADGRRLHGTSALLAEDGALHAVATGTWQALDEVPAREPGRPQPVSDTSPLKGGRPEARSDEEWGQPFPGRREAPGPRSEAPSDRDGREVMSLAFERDDPAEPWRSITGPGR